MAIIILFWLAFIIASGLVSSVGKAAAALITVGIPAAMIVFIGAIDWCEEKGYCRRGPGYEMIEFMLGPTLLVFLALVLIFVWAYQPGMVTDKM